MFQESFMWQVQFSLMKHAAKNLNTCKDQKDALNIFTTSGATYSWNELLIPVVLAVMFNITTATHSSRLVEMSACIILDVPTIISAHITDNLTEYDCTRIIIIITDKSKWELLLLLLQANQNGQIIITRGDWDENGHQINFKYSKNFKHTECNLQ